MDENLAKKLDGSKTGNEDFLRWLRDVMLTRPQNSYYLNSDRGIEIARLCIDFERDNYSWRRSDVDTFWIDIQLFTKYKLSDEEVLFAMKMQPGIENYKKNAPERNAYAEFMRGLNKLRVLDCKAKKMT